MARPKKQKFEYVPALKRYRKRVKDADGKYVTIYGKTEAELAAKLQEAQAVIEVGLILREDPTVEIYAQEWLPSVTAEMGEKYKESFEGAMRLHVLPVIGQLRLRDVRPDDCQRVMTQLAGKSKSLQSKVLNAMRRMFANAVKNDLLARNPCEDMKAGGKKTAKKRALTDAQIKTLLEAVAGTRADTFVHLGLFAGLRREESVGLRWEHVHLEESVPYLEIRSVVIYPNNAQPVEKDLGKSEAAFRVIPLSDELLAHLQGVSPKTGYVVGGGEKPLSYSQYSNLWAIVERRQTGTGFYWDTENGKTVRRTFERKLGDRSRGGNYCYTIDFEVTSHILRHTRATTWIKNGVDLKTVQYLLGHASADVTMDIYAHVVEESPEALAESIRNPLVLQISKTAQNEVKNEVKTGER